MLKYIFWTLFFTICTTINVFGQSYGGNRWSQKWQQLHKDQIRVIYPEGFEDQASRVFSIIDYLSQYDKESVGLKTDNLSIVLNNLTNISNGYVGLAPFRSEFFTTPPQNSFTLGSLPWLDLLSIHEYRHALQFANGKRGLSKLFSVLFGQSAYAGAINVAIPDWYFEGDAVLAETAFTDQGRGRIPHFLRAYRAYEAAGVRFNYEKVRNGSYKHFVPDHYRLGYMMNKFGADQYGATFWAEVLADASAYKGLIYPFSNAIKARSGHTTKSLYQATLDDYASTWASNGQDVTARQQLFPSKDKVFTNYRYPQYVDDALYYVKGSLNSISAVWTRNGQTEKKLITLGLSNDLYIDINGGKISWSELRFHPSRGNINYSVAMSYDIATGIKHQVSSQTRYSSPTSHPDGKVMAVVDIDELGQTQIKIISNRDGLVLDSLSNEQGHFITYPKWSEDGNHIYYAARDQMGKMAICQVAVNSSATKAITPWTNQPLGVPNVTSTHIYYSRSDATAENIYRTSIEDQTEELVVTSEFGAYQPSIKDNKVIYSDYTVDGLRLAQSEIKPMTIDDTKSIAISDKTYTAYSGGNLVSKLSTPTESPKKYGRLNRAINVHSWGITADDQTASILVQSDNVLNSLSLSGGLQYLFDDNRSIWTAGASFGFIYPNITTRFTQEGREANITIDDMTETIQFDDYNISVGLEAPLNLSSGAYIRSFLPHYAIEKRLFRGPRIEDVNFTSQRLGLVFLNRRLAAHQAIISPYSQYINLHYQGTIDDREGSQFDLETEFSFPGLMKSHALRIELDYNRQVERLYSSRFDQARGYPEIAAPNSFKFGVNYHMPVLYPDFGIGGMIYLKRIQANLFYDYSRLSSDDTKLDYSSTGMELIFDTNVINTLPVTFGIRYAYRVEPNDGVFEFFIPFYRF